MTGPVTHRALLVGVSRYGDESGFARLNGPPNDLRRLSQVLTDPVTGLFSVREPLAEPGTGALRRTIRRFLDLAAAEDHLLLYYSGHGEVGRTGQLCLTSTEAERDRPESDSLAFPELYEWILSSPARAITVVLDCCRAGIAMKGSPPDLSALFEPTPREGPAPARTVQVLTVGSGFENALDAAAATEPSPFTALLCTALAEDAAPDGEGLVTLDAVLDSIRRQAGGTGPTPRLWGDQGDAGPYVARRAAHLERLLDEAGVRPAPLQRAGAARRDGVDIHVEVSQVDRLVGHLVRAHPTTAYVVGVVGSGKTWMLCDVRDRLTDQGWQVTSLVPSRDPPSSQLLLSSLKRYAARLRGSPGPHLLVVDGVEWSEVWTEVVGRLHEVTALDGFGVSLLAALEDRRGQVAAKMSWPSREGLHVPAVVRGGLDDFVAALVSPEAHQEYAGWEPARLERARRDLRVRVGRDLWAAAHLGARWHTGGAEEEVVRTLWEDRIGAVGAAEVAALQRVAALGQNNLWCPLALAAEAGDALVRLGSEYSLRTDSVRLTSGFLNRAILARRVRDGRVSYSLERGGADRVAQPIITRYLAEVLLDENRQQEAVAAWTRLGYDRRLLAGVVGSLSRPAGTEPDIWQRWADGWTDLAPVVQVLSTIRTVLEPARAAVLGDRLCRLVLDQADEAYGLPTLTTCLEVLRELFRGRRAAPELEQAYDMLAGLAERLLERQRWPAGLRRRLLRVLRRLDRLDDAAVRRIGPKSLRPMSPPGLPDLELVLDFPRLVSPGRRHSSLRAELAGWEVVTEELLRSPEADEDAGLEQLTVRRMLAQHLLDEETVDRLTPQVVRRLRTAGAAELERVLAVCTRHDRRYAAGLVGTLNVTNWSATTLRATPAATAVRLVKALSRIRPDVAVQALRRPDGTPDADLAGTLAAGLQPAGDAANASLLLRTAARLEEQWGLLDGGFAQAFAAALGVDFLADTMRNDSRVSIVNHLVNGYAAARSPLLASVRSLALEIVESQIAGSSSELGPRLALLLADHEVLGEDFLTELRDRDGIRLHTMLSRMRDSRHPGALAAHHELGIVLFPGVEERFVHEIEEAGEPWTEMALFADLAREGDVVAALRAGTAITSTLVLSGVADAGGMVLDSFQRAHEANRPGRRWSERAFEAEDLSLAEGLRLLHRLRPAAARELVEQSPTRLVRAARRLHQPRALADLLAVAAKLSPEAAERVAGRCEEEGLLEDSLDDLLTDGDLFEQAAALASLRQAEDRLFRRLLPDDVAERFVGDWAAQVPSISNPRLVASLVATAGGAGSAAAMRVAGAANTVALQRRLTRMNPADAEGYAQLVTILGELTPARVLALVGPDEARWLLWHTPVPQLGRLAETLADARVLPADGIGGMLRLRLNLSPERVSARNRQRHWIGVGWSAWAAARLSQPLQLGNELDPRVCASVPPYVALWAVTWLESGPKLQDARTQAVSRLRAGGVPDRPWAAAAALTAISALGAEESLCGTGDLSGWQHAVDAGDNWVRALFAAAADRPTGRLATAMRTEWAPWAVQRARLGLTWRSHGWRAVPTQALTTLADLQRSPRRHQPVPTRPRRQSEWVRPTGPPTG